MFAVQDLKAKKIAIFDDGTTGPKGAADEVDKRARSLGAQVLRYQVRAGDKDFRSILGTVPKDVDLIVPSLWAPETALIAKQLPDAGLDVRLTVPTDSSKSKTTSRPPAALPKATTSPSWHRT